MNSISNHLNKVKNMFFDQTTVNDPRDKTK